MEGWKFRTAAAFALIATAGALYYLAGTGGGGLSPSSAPVLTPLEKSETASIEGFRFVDQDLSRIRMKMTAKKAVLKDRKYRNLRIALSKVMELEGPEITIYGEDGKAVVLAGPSAVVDPLKKAVFFGQGGSASSGRGAVESKKLTWYYKRSYLQADGGYTYKMAGRQYTGERLYLDMRLRVLDPKTISGLTGGMDAGTLPKIP